MTVEEAYKTLKDPKMAKKQCNFKITGGSRITNTDILKELKTTKTELLLAISKTNDRLDKLEKLVVTQFKKHGWIQ